MSPCSTRRLPTAAPMAPGAITATTGFIALVSDWRWTWRHRNLPPSAPQARRPMEFEHDRAATRVASALLAAPAADFLARAGDCDLLRVPHATSVISQEAPSCPTTQSRRYELALASRMLANESVLDAFGHVSLRHPGDPGRFLLSRSRSPQLVEPADILEYTLDAEPVRAADAALVRRARHPRLHLSGAARRHGGVPSSCGGGAAVLHRRRADRSGLSSRRRRRERRSRSGTSRTSSATPISWWPSPRRGARSPARSARTRRC